MGGLLAMVASIAKIPIEALATWKKRQKAIAERNAEKKAADKAEKIEQHEEWKAQQERIAAEKARLDAEWKEIKRRGLELRKKNAAKRAAEAKEDVRIIKEENPYK